MRGSVTLRVPRVVAERIREKSRGLGMSPVEYIVELTLGDLDPPERAREYVDAAKSLLEQAEEELERGDVRQAAEKVWGAAALAVKAYASWRMVEGWPVTGNYGSIPGFSGKSSGGGLVVRGRRRTRCIHASTRGGVAGSTWRTRWRRSRGL